MLSGTDLLIALTIVLVGATVMGTLGFGLGLVTVPVLMVLVEPQSVVVIVNGSIAVLMLLVLLQLRHHLDLKLVGGMALGGLAATPIGVLALGSASPTILRMAIALVILMLAVLSLFRVPLPFAQNRLAGPVLGFLASLSVTTLSIGGPLVAIYAVNRGWAPQVMRASLALYFLVFEGSALTLYALSGLADREDAGNIAILLPAVVIGFALASILVERMNAPLFRYAVIGVIIAGGLMLLGREIASI